MGSPLCVSLLILHGFVQYAYSRFPMEQRGMYGGPESPREFLWRLHDNDPCEELASVDGQDPEQPWADSACLSAHLMFQILTPASEKRSCLNYREPAICRVDLPPGDRTPKCSFVCDDHVNGQRVTVYRPIGDIMRTVTRPKGKPAPKPTRKRSPSPPPPPRRKQTQNLLQRHATYNNPISAAA